jgi:microcystin-dependent protein
MSCNNCGNGCTEIQSDKCIKYTGVNIPALGINNGDYLCQVETQIIDFLLTALDGTGVIIDVDPFCEVVSSNLTVGEELTIVNVTTALIKAVCSIQTQVTSLSDSLTSLSEIVSAIEVDYTVDCLGSVTASSGTHAILQEVITTLCELQTNLSTNYVQGGTPLNEYIQNYLDSQTTASLMRDKMVPYVAMEYFGSMSYFDSSGAGTGDWVSIYLCNGRNNTPDMRGRIPVCAIQGMNGLTLDPEVDPTESSDNPNYSLSDKGGSNAVTLSINQIPTHSHNNLGDVTIVPHTHFTVSEGSSGVLTSSTPIKRGVTLGGNTSYDLQGASSVATEGLTSPTEQSIVSVNMTNASAGGSLSHTNIPPVISCYYIMYRP